MTKPPQLKLFTSSPQGQAYQAMSLPNSRSLYFGIQPINCLRRDSFGWKSIPSCNCPGEERKLQPVSIFIRTVILKGVGSGTPVTSSLRQIPILVNSDWIIVYFVEECQRGLLSPFLELWPLELLYHFSNVILVTPASTDPASRSPLDLLYTVNFCLVMGVPYMC